MQMGYRRRFANNSKVVQRYAITILILQWDTGFLALIAQRFVYEIEHLEMEHIKEVRSPLLSVPFKTTDYILRQLEHFRMHKWYQKENKNCSPSVNKAKHHQ